MWYSAFPISFHQIVNEHLCGRIILTTLNNHEIKSGRTDELKVDGLLFLKSGRSSNRKATLKWTVFYIKGGCLIKQMTVHFEMTVQFDLSPSILDLTDKGIFLDF